MKPILANILSKAVSATGTLTTLTLIFLGVHCLWPGDALVNTMLTGFGSALLLALRTETKGDSRGDAETLSSKPTQL